MQISGRGFSRLTQTVCVVLRVNALKSDILRWALDFQEIKSFYEKNPGEDEYEASSKSGRPDNVGRQDIVSV